jgi:hypothetical protein
MPAPNSLDQIRGEGQCSIVSDWDMQRRDGEIAHDEKAK